MMHREVVAKKKAPVIAICLVIITCMLYIHEGLKFVEFENRGTLEVCNTIIIVLTGAILLREVVLCSTSYKYSIIADKLIVNKIIRSKEKNLESIKISDIEYIGMKGQEPNELKCISVKSYLCGITSSNKCVCIYKKKGKLHKFTFEPSEDLILRVNKKIK